MAAKKSAAKPATPTPPTKVPEGAHEAAGNYSVTGVEMVDGLPVFATLNGVKVNRRQWIEATRPGRKAQLVADLRAEAEAIASEAQQGNVAE